MAWHGMPIMTEHLSVLHVQKLTLELPLELSPNNCVNHRSIENNRLKGHAEV